MWYLHACPRCGGDMRDDESPGAPQCLSCVQCGHEVHPGHLAVARPAKERRIPHNLAMPGVPVQQRISA